MRRGDYGYDAPYFPVIFGFLTVVAGLGAAISWWQGVVRPAVQMTLYFVFFLGNTSSFLYTTRRGKFLEWDQFWIAFICAATKGYSTWVAAEALC